MNRTLFTITILTLLLVVGGGVWFFWPQEGDQTPAPSQQTPVGGQFQPVSVSVPTDASAQAIQEVRAAYQKLLVNNQDNVKLYNTSVVGEYALQKWVGDVMGGQALLRYDSAQAAWVIVSPGGGAWSVGGLEAMGVPQGVAQQLLQGLATPAN